MEIIIGLMFGNVVIGFYNIICIHRKVNEILDILKSKDL